MSFQTGDILIKAEGICKQFGAVKALEDVSFTLRRGEIMGLAGHNGAGKSVLIKIMGGVYQPDRGRIWFNGEEVKLHSPRDAQERGYYIVPQELTVARQLSVADNIFIGRDEFASKYSGIVNKKYIYEKAAQLLREFFNIDVDPTVPVGELDTVTQRLIQVVRCLSAGAKVIVFDETTAGLSQRERDKLFQHIRILAEKGIGIIFISHILSEIMEMCDRVTVLREGKVIGIEEVQNLTIPKLIEMIAGREVRTNTCEKVFPAEEVILSVEGLSTKNKRLSNISFQIKKGEIVGIYGLRDQGQTLLLETIFGAYKRTTGEIKLEGKKVKIKSPVDALRQGIVYVPNRGIKTVFPFKSVVENLILQFSNFKESGIFIRERTEKLFVEEIVRKFTVRGYLSIDEKLSSLSGGNMQKVLIARAMILRPKLLMLIEPTEGIDIGAKQEVKELILQAAKEGTAVIIVTSEIDDIIELCNRVIVIRDGKIRNIMEANEENRRAIIEESIA